MCSKCKAFIGCHPHGCKFMRDRLASAETTPFKPPVGRRPPGGAPDRHPDAPLRGTPRSPRSEAGS